MHNEEARTSHQNTIVRTLSAAQVLNGVGVAGTVAAEIGRAHV